MLPNGGSVARMIKAYFDESGSHDDLPVLCVAGYLLNAANARALGAKWQTVLAEYGLPYFRMSACAHGSKPFDKLSREDRIAVETKMIAIIGEHATAGLGATMAMNDYSRYMPEHPLVGGAYTFCVRMCLGGAVSILEELHIPGNVAYFFEFGHRHQGEANTIMNDGFLQSN